MSDELNQDLAFGKQNYIFLIAGIFVIILGFILLSGGGSENPNKFNPEIFSPRRMTLAPIIILLGYGTIIFAIMKKPKETSEE